MPPLWRGLAAAEEDAPLRGVAPVCANLDELVAPELLPVRRGTLTFVDSVDDPRED